MLRAAALVAGNDVRIQVRNRSLLILGFAVPLGLAFVLNLVFGGLDDPDAPVTFDVGAAVLDDGPVGVAFGSMLDGLAEGGLLDLTRYDDEAAARAAVERGEVAAAWVVPAGVERITVVADVDATTTAGAARAIAAGFADRSRTFELAGRVAVAAGVDPPADVPGLVGTASVETSSGRLDPTTTVTAGMALFFVFFTAGLPLLGIVAERSNGTLARLLVAPVPQAAILAGKVAAAVALGVVSVGALMVASALLMGAEWPPAALLLVVAAVVAIAGIVAAAGSFARTSQQAAGIQTVVALGLGVVGGTFVPVERGAGGVRDALQSATPNGLFLDGLVLLRDDGFAAALPTVGALLAIGVVTGGAGLWRAGKLLRP